jgi:hypothetical protein
LEGRGVIVLAWVAFAALYLLLAGQVSAEEMVAASLIGFGILAFSRHLVHLASHRLKLRLPWWRLLRSTAASLAKETVRVAALLLPWRPFGEGVVMQQPFAFGGDAPADVARRGAVQLALSMAPNGIVLARPEGSESLPVHRLDPRQPASPDRCWPV